MWPWLRATIGGAKARVNSITAATFVCSIVSMSCVHQKGFSREIHTFTKREQSPWSEKNSHKSSPHRQSDNDLFQFVAEETAVKDYYYPAPLVFTLKIFRFTCCTHEHRRSTQIDPYLPTWI